MTLILFQNKELTEIRQTPGSWCVRRRSLTQLSRMVLDGLVDPRFASWNPLADWLRLAVSLNRAVDVSFTMVAEAREYRESVALSKMSPEEREKYLEHQEMALDAE